MAAPFSQTIRSLQTDRFRRPALLLSLSVLLLLGWGCWLSMARVSIYVVTETARLEAEQAVHHIEAPVQGRITAVHALLGQEVEAGALLFSLDATTQQLLLEETEAQRAALKAQLQALQQEQVTGGRALAQTLQVGTASVDEGRAQYEEARAAAELAEGEAARIRQLFEKKHVSVAEYERATAKARQQRAAADAMQQRLRRMDLSGQQENSDRRVRLDQLSREMAQLEGEIATTEATLARLSHDIEQRSVRAPVAGRVGELAEVRVGAFVEAGNQLGAIIPEGALRAVAYFAPSEAVGRLKPGQTAHLRLKAFPWTQYGSVSATVIRVADEVQDDRVRVELQVQPGSAPRIPLQHGLPGTLEVQIERTAPATLLLRHIGKRLQS